MISSHIFSFFDVIIHTCHDFNDHFAKLPLKSGHVWANTYHYFVRMQLLIQTLHRKEIFSVKQIGSCGQRHKTSSVKRCTCINTWKLLNRLQGIKDVEVRISAFSLKIIVLCMGVAESLAPISLAPGQQYLPGWLDCDRTAQLILPRHIHIFLHMIVNQESSHYDVTVMDIWDDI